MGIPIITLKLKYEHDTVLSRQRARQIASHLGFELREQTAISTAVSEIVRNTLSYAGEGIIEFTVDDKADPQLFLIKIKDNGPGIKDLETILGGRYKSTTGMGMGILGSRRLMDYFHIESSKEKGTLVLLGKELPRDKVIRPTVINEITKQLAAGSPKSFIEEVQQQNQELMRTLDELKKRQEELIRLNRELEETNRGVVALYAELDERAEHLKHANDLKARFLSNISHEFRTPLNSILGLSKLLVDRVDGELTEEQEKQVRFIMRSAEGLTDLVNDLLDLAKVEAGKVTIKAERFDVPALFATLRGMFKPLLTNPELTLNFAEPKDNLTLYSDEAKVSQILRNFISNAIKFTPHGEIRVSAEAGDNGSTVIFAVSDTGIGIEGKYLDFIFEEFTQVENPAQKNVKGTGLGLPLSRKFAELLGGSISVESTPGAGSTFYLKIPADFLLQRRSGQDAAPGRKKILIIDDEEISRYILRGLLGNENYDLLEADNGILGIEIAEREKPDVIFLDLIMPEMNGLEVLETLRQKETTRNIPVIVNTSKILEDSERNTFQELKAEVISKRSLSQPGSSEVLRELAEKQSMQDGQ